MYLSLCYSLANMKTLHWLFISVILNTLLFVVPGGCYRIPTLPDNCTCVTREGKVYSLFPLRRKGKPRFTETGFEPHQNYYYSYNPCVPYTFTSKKGICENVALCKYNKDDQPVYNDIGDQRDVHCDISDGKVALIYPIGSGPYHDQESRVNLVCDNNTKAQDEFTLISENNLIFQLTSYCGCPNKCLPTSTARPVSESSSRPETASTRPGTPSSPRATDGYSNWELKILLPSLLGALVLLAFFVCFWMRLSVIQTAHLCRCCHCYEQNNQNRDPLREERNVFANEKSALISHHENGRAVEHEYPGVKRKLNEPVQEEDGNPTKDCSIVVT